MYMKCYFSKLVRNVRSISAFRHAIRMASNQIFSAQTATKKELSLSIRYQKCIISAKRFKTHLKSHHTIWLKLGDRPHSSWYVADNVTRYHIDTIVAEIACLTHTLFCVCTLCLHTMPLHDACIFSCVLKKP